MKFLSKEYQAVELLRPWKLISLLIGMSWLLYGAVNYHIADWDVGVSILMGVLTYLTAPWCVTTIFHCLRNRTGHWVLWIIFSLFVSWIVVDASYVIYHRLVGNQIYRAENFYASSALYFLTGMVWMYQGSLSDFFKNLQQFKN